MPVMNDSGCCMVAFSKMIAIMKMKDKGEEGREEGEDSWSVLLPESLLQSGCLSKDRQNLTASLSLQNIELKVKENELAEHSV